MMLINIIEIEKNLTAIIYVVEFKVIQFKEKIIIAMQQLLWLQLSIYTFSTCCSITIMKSPEVD